MKPALVVALGALVACGAPARDAGRAPGDTQRVAPADSAAREPHVATPTASDTLWLYAADPARDAIPSDATEAKLIARFGASNVRRDTIPLGEGEFVNGTVLFPDDDRRRLQITWRDTVARAVPATENVADSPSLWTVAPGIRMGTSLAELEALNGKPFTLLGFGWDYAGTVSSWEGGRLDSLIGPGRGRMRVIVRLYPDSAYEALIGQVQGDHVFPSSHPAMRAMNPRVYALTLAP
ncbi:MAG TPA: hypothetical protein VHM30_01550 [Gemmatimonadaceae bacterium]|nr:hypothetical protein [Gemmatimonadaceae bacterium]